MESKASEAESTLKSTQEKNYTCCCGLLKYSSATLIISLLDLVILSQGMIFTGTYSYHSEATYRKGSPEFYRIVKYEYLLPLFILHGIWILMIALSFVGIKATYPIAVLPLSLYQGVIGFMVGLSFSAMFIVEIAETEMTNSMVISIVFAFFIFTLLQSYFAFITHGCYRYLIEERNRQAVQRMWQQTASSTSKAYRKQKAKQTTTKGKSIWVTSRASKMEYDESSTRPASSGTTSTALDSQRNRKTMKEPLFIIHE